MLLYYRFYHKKIEIRTSRTNCNSVKEYFCYLPPPATQKIVNRMRKKEVLYQKLLGNHAKKM